MRMRNSSKRSIPRALSPGEEAFALHCRAESLTPEREFAFHPERQWRFDFAFVEQKLGVEIEGGLRGYGRHQRPRGFEKDAEKYNAAVKLGWRVLRYSTPQVFRGDAINDVLEILGIAPRRTPRGNHERHES